LTLGVLRPRVAVTTASEGARHEGFGETREVLDQHMALAQERCKRELQFVVLAHDHAFDVGDDAFCD